MTMTPRSCSSPPLRVAVVASTGTTLPCRPGSVTVAVRPVRHWMAAWRSATSSGAWPRTSVTWRPADGGRGRAAEQGLGGAVQRDHAAVEIEGDDPVGQGVEDVIGVALEVGELAEAPAKLRVGGLERRPPLEERRALLVELARHLVERGGELPDLVPGRRLDTLDQLAPRDARRARRELPDRPGDPAGDERRSEACSAQDQDGQEHQLAPRGGDLHVHPPAREPDPGRPPRLGVHLDRHREVVERLAVRPVDLLDRPSRRTRGCGRGRRSRRRCPSSRAGGRGRRRARRGRGSSRRPRRSRRPRARRSARAACSCRGPAARSRRPPGPAPGRPRGAGPPG